MNKIPTIFVRNAEKRHLVTDEVNEVCRWVFDGEGKATVKMDGTCCMIENGILFKRREVRLGEKVPEGFRQVERDPITGKTFGWIAVGEGPEDAYHREGFSYLMEMLGIIHDGTYELLGPKIQGNPEKYDRHVLFKHSHMPIIPEDNYLRTYDGIRTCLDSRDIEGIVFHHPDGRMAKIKGRDFGIKRK